MGMKVKRKFYGYIPKNAEHVEVLDFRVVIDTTNMRSKARTTALGDQPHCSTKDGRQVRVKDNRAKYVDVENLEGEWEIKVGSAWCPLHVSTTPIRNE